MRLHNVVLYLVDHAVEVSIGPSLLVQIVGLEQHAGQLLGSNVAMGLAPTLNLRGKQGVAEPVDRTHECLKLYFPDLSLNVS